jgi:hypothetical protein
LILTGLNSNDDFINDREDILKFYNKVDDISGSVLLNIKFNERNGSPFMVEGSDR